MQAVARTFQEIVRESAEKERRHKPDSTQPQLSGYVHNQGCTHPRTGHLTGLQPSRSPPFLSGYGHGDSDGTTAGEREALIQKAAEKQDSILSHSHTLILSTRNTHPCRKKLVLFEGEMAANEASIREREEAIRGLG
jgi:hypothetical protein